MSKSMLSFYYLSNIGVFVLAFLGGYSIAHSQTKASPWYGAEGFAGISTGKCIETTSAAEVDNLAKMGMAKIISEKSSGGKVVELTFSFQGRPVTIYREKATCEAVAAAINKRQNTTPDKYK